MVPNYFSWMGFPVGEPFQGRSKESWKMANKMPDLIIFYSQGFIDWHPEFSMSFIFRVTTVRLFL